MSNLKLAVVGHTNVGKTSVLRTLLRDPEFGDVDTNPSTTRNVIEGQINVQQDTLYFYDTPGLEDGIGLYEYLLQLQQYAPAQRHDGPALLQAFLQSSEAEAGFAQEAKVLRQLLQCDAALYVVDVRDPVLPKFQDELAILSKAARPILPILNFTASPAPYTSAWQQALGNVNLHAWVEFDSVSPQQEGELTIYQHLRTLMPNKQSPINTLLTEITKRRQGLEQSASHLIAELLVDCAALRIRVEGEPTADHTQSLQQSVQDLQMLVRQREQRCLESLLRLYRFHAGSVSFDSLAMTQGRWENDLFHPQSLRQFGIKTGKAAATGAAAGAGVDILMLGTTLGAGTAIGAMLGGAWQSWQSYGRRIKDRIRGYHDLTIESSVLALMCARQQQLIQILSHRGHAATHMQTIPVNPSAYIPTPTLIALFEEARAYPQWSALVSEDIAQYNDNETRQHFIKKLSGELTTHRIAAK